VDKESEAPSQPHLELHVDNLSASWGETSYVELSIVLVHLRYLAMLHQTHHWISRGDNFYSDHKLFEGLYSTIVEEIDEVAEKAVGYGSDANVNLQLQISQLLRLSNDCGSPQTVPQASDLAKASLCAEWNFLKVMSSVFARLREQGTMTDGIENMLQSVCDTHEKHIYLLKRRCSTAPLGL
jgi:DNA-binding ferritin-like protein